MEDLSLLDWLYAFLAQPRVQRYVRFGLALAAAVVGGYLLVDGSAGSAYVFLGISAILFLWGLAVQGEAVTSVQWPTAEGPAEEGVLPAETVVPAPPPQPLDPGSFLLTWGLWPIAVALAFAAQFIFDFRAAENNAPWVGTWLYVLAAILAAAAFWLRKIDLPPAPEDSTAASERFVLQPLWLGSMVATFAAAYTFFSGGRFNPANLFFWALTLIFTLLFLSGFPPEQVWLALTRMAARVVERLRRGICISPWTLLLLAAFSVALFFRLYDLEGVPPVMTSDHAEKLYDVMDVLNGQYMVFFERNTGREFLQFYIAAAIVKLLGTGITHLTLKISSAIMGILLLPFIYGLGKEVADRRVGLLAMFLAGIAYWPNVISRVGLRFPYYPAFVGPALFFLVRGLRRRCWTDFLWAGISLGLGLHGYTPIRVLPLVMAVAVGLYVVHRAAAGARWWAVAGLGAAALTAVVVAMPLIHYSLHENPEMVWGRVFTRLSQSETVYPENEWCNWLADRTHTPREKWPRPVCHFFTNQWNSARMFMWNNGAIWIMNVANRPALDWISAALFMLGFWLLLMRYLRQRRWLDLFVLLGIPLLLLPSSLALAFPNENPALNRSSGAVPLVFLLPALAGVAILDFLRANLPAHLYRSAAVGLGGAALLISVWQNYDLALVRYPQEYHASAGSFVNSQEIGRVIDGFAHSDGSYDRAYVVPYPYWVDTRLVGIYANNPAKDYAFPPEMLSTLTAGEEPLMVIFHRDDAETLEKMIEMFPQGHLHKVVSSAAGNDFYVFTVPGAAVRPQSQ